MKFVVLFFILISFCLSAGPVNSAPTPERISEIAKTLSAKPYGLGDPISERKIWDVIAKSENGPVLMKQAEDRLKTKPPVLTEELYTLYARKGTRPEWEAPFNEKMQRVASFVIAECLENKGRFLPIIEEELEGVLNEGTWCSAAHSGGDANHFNGTIDINEAMVDLAAGARAWSVATIDYWLQDKLSPVIRKHIRSELKRRMWDPYLLRSRKVDPKNWWWMVGYNNWTAIVTGGVVGSALTLIDSPQERAEFIAQAEITMPFYIAGFADDGFCDEGIGYWYYGFGHFMFITELIREQTSGKIDYFQDPKVFKMATYPFRLEVGNNVFPAFGDGGANSKMDTTLAAYVARRYGIRQDILDPSVKRDVSYGHGLGPLMYRFSFSYFMDKVPPATARLTEDLTLGGVRDAFEEGGVWVFRPKGANPQGLAIAIKGGHNAESHNHHDMGSYTIISEGQMILYDLGADTYSKDTFGPKRYESEVINGFGHAVPVVDHFTQSQGISTKDNKALSNCQAVVVDRHYSPSEDRLVLDLKSGYGYNVPELKTLNRSFIYHRTNDTAWLEIIDDVEFSEAKDFGSCLTFTAPWKDLGNQVYQVGGGAFLKVTVTSEGGPVKMDLRDKLKSFAPSGYKTANRMGFEFVKPVTKGRLRYLIEPLKNTVVASRTLPVLNAQTVLPVLDSGVLRIEAENFSKEIGGGVEKVSKTGASGSALKGWDQPGHVLTWNVTAPKTGWYALSIRYCGDLTTPSKRSIRVNGKSIAGGAVYDLPSTGGWSTGTDAWANVTFSDEGHAKAIFLKEGANELSLENQAGPANLDYLELKPLKEIEFNFEDGLENWTLSETVPMTFVSNESAHSGKYGLRIVDEKTDGGSSLASVRFAAKPGKDYQLTFWARSVNGNAGLSVYIKFYDSSGKQINAYESKTKEDMVTCDGDKNWKLYTLKATASEKVASMDLWIHSTTKSTPISDIDDMKLEGLE